MLIKQLCTAMASIGFLSINSISFAQETPANAAKQNSQNSNAPVQKVEVTGSKIRRVNAETASPVTIITRAEMVRDGSTSLTEVLKNISSNLGGIDENRTNGFTAGASGLNLRGIGSQATLVLINGRRLAPYAQPEYQTTFVDLNSVPIGAVERIEILKDGASAIYGSEAIAGVVNIIMRENFEGAEASVSFAQSKYGDGGQNRASVSYGFGSLVENKFNVYATLDVRNRKPMLLKEREGYLSTQDLRQWGYADQRSLYTFPGNIYWTDKATGAFAVRPLSGNCPANRLVPASNIFGPATKGEACVYDDFQDSTYNASGKSDRVGITSRATWQMNADTILFAEVMANRTKANVQGVPHWFAGQNGQQTPALPITHPQYPKDLIDPVTGKTLVGGNGTVRVRASLSDLPGQGLENTTTFGRYLLGAKGTVKTWDWEAAAMYNSSKVDSRSTAGLLSKPLVSAYTSGKLIFGSIASNPTLMNSLFTNTSSNYKTEMILADAKVSGELMQLPAGALTGAVGIEARRETLDINPDPQSVAGEIYHYAPSQPGYKRSRDIRSLWTELNIPITKDIESQIAVRHDRYSDYGNSTTPKIGAKWNISPKFAVRATHARGFRAPTLVENSSSNQDAYLSYEDPARCNAVFKGGCQWNSRYISGSNPDLKPETAKSYTLGLIFEPTNWLNATVDFWQIKRIDEISTYDLKTVLNNPARFAGNSAVQVVRDPLTAADKAAGATAGEITLLKMLLTNVAETQVRGVDVEMRGKFDLGERGKLFPRFFMTYNHSYKSAPAPDAEKIEYAGSRNLPRVRANIGTSWQKAAWQASIDADYVGSFASTGDFTQTCEFENLGYPNLCQDIQGFTTFNVGGSYSGLYKNLKLSFAIRNVLDRKPPFAPSPYSSQSVSYSNLHDVIGRYFQVTVEYKFK